MTIRPMRKVVYLITIACIAASCGRDSPRSAPAGPEFAVSPQGITSLEGRWRVMAGDSPGYAADSLDDSGWPLAAVPGNLMAVYPEYRGIAWYRARVFFPAEKAPGDYMIQLGRICDVDEFYVNGVLVGNTGTIGDPLSHAFDRTRYYLVPRNLVRPGAENLIAVRVRGYLSDSMGMIWGDYFLGPPEQMKGPVFRGYAADIFFVGVYLFIAVYFFIFSMMSRSMPAQQRYFALFSLSLSAYIFCQSQIKYLFTDHFYYFHYAQYIVGIGCTGAALMMFRSFFALSVTKSDRLALAVLGIAAAAITVIPEIRDWTAPRLLWHASVLYLIVVSGYHIVKSIVSRDWSRLYVYIGFFVIIAGALMELLRAHSLVPDFDYLKFGLIGLIVMISFFIATQLSNIQRIEESIMLKLENEVQERTRDLFERNRTIEEQLEIARLIYDKIIPEGPPELDGIAFHAACVPMDTVGGDFYDYRIGDGTAALFIGDVSGHGVPGAFLALITKLAFRQILTETVDIGRILKFMNHAVCDSAVLSNFVTGMLCVLDLRNKRLFYSYAGHPPCYIIRERGIEEIPAVKRSIPLGLNKAQRYEQREYPVEQGDRLVLYTDGVTEAINGEGRMFGETRFRDLLLESRCLSVRECVDGILERVRDYSGGDIGDDITLMVIDIL